MPEKPISVTVGDGPCPLCGADGQYKANKKGRLYFYCKVPDDGGCGSSTMSRGRDGVFASRVKKWRKPEYRAAYLGEPSEPEPDPEPEPEPDDRPDPEPQPELTREPEVEHVVEDDAPEETADEKAYRELYGVTK